MANAFFGIIAPEKSAFVELESETLRPPQISSDAWGKILGFMESKGLAMLVSNKTRRYLIPALLRAEPHPDADYECSCYAHFPPTHNHVKDIYPYDDLTSGRSEDLPFLFLRIVCAWICEDGFPDPLLASRHWVVFESSKLFLKRHRILEVVLTSVEKVE
jgi:hypothetical protein